eukprot:COSAG05_NODE_346_length_10975_cov_5.664675_5_plen_148_part_00
MQLVEKYVTDSLSRIWALHASACPCACVCARLCGAPCMQVIKVADVVYMTRVQKERFDVPPTDAEYEAIVASYTVTTELMALAKSDMRLLHPLPRVGEIKEGVDVDPRAAYFRQMRYGMCKSMHDKLCHAECLHQCHAVSRMFVTQE